MNYQIDEYLYPITDLLDFSSDSVYAMFTPYGITLSSTHCPFTTSDAALLRLFHSYFMFSTEVYVAGEDVDGLPIGDGRFKPFAEKFIRIINETYPIYKPQIDAYEAKADQLLNPISTTSESKNGLSSAPQTATLASDDGTDELDSLSHATASATDDGGTPIMRLKEIHDNIASVYSEWYHDIVGRIAIQ